MHCLTVYKSYVDVNVTAIILLSYGIFNIFILLKIPPFTLWHGNGEGSVTEKHFP